MMTPMRSQRGSTLFIGLVMLVILTMFAVSSLNSSTINLKVVGNMQSRSEALNAAQEAIETTISTPQFIANRRRKSRLHNAARAGAIVRFGKEHQEQPTRSH